VIAAMYCRKSNPEEGKPDEFRSVERQRAACEAFAEARGWTVAPEHCYTDDKPAAPSSARDGPPSRGCSTP
jgi:DNA invertase Pin-like site-specific DNA recombinase